MEKEEKGNENNGNEQQGELMKGEEYGKGRNKKKGRNV